MEENFKILVENSYQIRRLRNEWVVYYLYILFGKKSKKKIQINLTFKDIYSLSTLKRSNLSRGLTNYFVKRKIVDKKKFKFSGYRPDFRLLFLLPHLPEIQMKKRVNKSNSSNKSCLAIEKYFNENCLKTINTFINEANNKRLTVPKDPYLSNDDLILDINYIINSLNKVQELYSNSLLRWVCFNPLLHLSYVKDKGLPALIELMYKILPDNYNFECLPYFFEFIRKFKGTRRTKKEMLKMFKMLFVYSKQIVRYKEGTFIMDKNTFSIYKKEVDNLLESTDEKDLIDFFNSIWDLYNINRYLNIFFSQAAKKIKVDNKLIQFFKQSSQT